MRPPVEAARFDACLFTGSFSIKKILVVVAVMNGFQHGFHWKVVLSCNLFRS
jgi:hypothetical protein